MFEQHTLDLGLSDTIKKNNKLLNQNSCVTLKSISVSIVELFSYNVLESKCALVLSTHPGTCLLFYFYIG